LSLWGTEGSQFGLAIRVPLDRVVRWRHLIIAKLDGVAVGYGNSVVAYKTSRHRKDIYQRIFISYPISKNRQKVYILSFFGAGYFEDIISKF
jgi:hypothetical protein